MLPKYEIIKQDIIKKINDGEFVAGEKIYSEGDLKKLYNVSNTTVVKALNDLVSDGYLIRKQGEGTFVRKNLKHRKVLFSEQLLLSKNNESQKFEEKTVTLISEPIENTEICSKLGDQTGSKKLIKISQIGLINNHPWKIQNRYLLEDSLDAAAIARLTRGASLSDELHLDSNLSNLPMEINITVTQLAKDSEELEPLRTLNQSFGEKNLFALFDITRLTFDQAGKPLEYSQSFIHPEYYYINIIGE